MAEDAWNSRDPERVALAYTEGSRWRNRNEFITGRAEIAAFLTRKWQRELSYRLIKEVWAFHEHRIAVRFAYEWHDDKPEALIRPIIELNDCDFSHRSARPGDIRHIMPDLNIAKWFRF